MIKLNNRANYLITGGTGFLGQALIARLIKMGINQFTVVSRNEGKLIKLANEFPKADFTLIPGDIADECTCRKAFEGTDATFHLAAFKYAPWAETHSWQCTRSNVIGSMNILDLAVQNKQEFILGISTDKATQVAGVYGASKLLMERLFQECEKIHPCTKFRIVRYGNVLYSTGSVLTKWRKCLENNQPITITEPKATRFYWTVDQAIDLIFECLEKAADATPYCPSMKSVRIADLAVATTQKYGKEPYPAFNIIGLQPGENVHERIMENGPMSNEVEHYTVEELMEMI